MANVFERCLRQQSRSPNTHAHAHTHIHCHTQPHQGTTHRHHTQATETKAHSTTLALGHTARHTRTCKPIPAHPHCQCTLQEAPAHRRCQGNSPRYTLRHKITCGPWTHGMMRTPKHAHSRPHTDALPTLGPIRVFSYILLQLANTFRTPVYSLPQQFIANKVHTY